VGSRLTVRTPDDYLFVRDVCSYGYFVLAPNVWDPIERSLTRKLELPGGPSTLVMTQPGGQPGSPLRVVADRTVARGERAELVGALTRMLRLDESSADLAAFHRADPRWRPTGRGRLFRSPTLFEDVVKTVTSCNVAWPSTVKMNEKLCALAGGVFPSPDRLARTRPRTLRARCGVGYRDARLVELARIFTRREIDEETLVDPASGDDDVFTALLGLPGIGPYAAGNIMQLLGRYTRLAIDTETERHARTVLGMTSSGRALTAAIEAHYAGFGDHRFRSYWFEVWAWYEKRRGPSWTWAPKETGPSVTAAAFGYTRRRAAGLESPPAPENARADHTHPHPGSAGAPVGPRGRRGALPGR